MNDKPTAIDVRVAGYRWALEQERHSEYDRIYAYGMFEDAFHISPYDPQQPELFEAWLQGIADSDWLIEADTQLSVSDIAEKTGFDKSYIKAEIEAGRLQAVKWDTAKTFRYIIHPDEFRQWYKSSKRRGSKSK